MATWKKEEIECLKHLYNKHSFREIANILNRGIKSVSRKAEEMGLVTKGPSRKWTKEEDERLRILFPNRSQKDLAFMFGRSWQSVQARARKLKIYKKTGKKRWSDKEVQFLQKYYADLGVADIADQLGKAVESIRKKAKHLGLKQQPRWTKKEVELLRQTYEGEVTDDLLCLFPQRSRLSVYNKIAQEGLQQCLCWTGNELQILKEHYTTSDPIDLLALLPGRSWQAITSYAYKRFGLKRPLILYRERLMKSQLDKLYPGEEYNDNIRPEWLINPPTGKRMELDRYYPRLELAFEYNGEQHYRPSFSKKNVRKEQKKVRAQQKRDEHKREICQQKGVKLIVFNRCDVLSLNFMKSKIGG